MVVGQDLEAGNRAGQRDRRKMNPKWRLRPKAKAKTTSRMVDRI
jgi:hypothetical protein